MSMKTASKCEDRQQDIPSTDSKCKIPAAQPCAAGIFLFIREFYCLTVDRMDEPKKCCFALRRSLIYPGMLQDLCKYQADLIPQDSVDVGCVHPAVFLQEFLRPVRMLFDPLIPAQIAAGSGWPLLTPPSPASAAQEVQPDP